MANETLTQQQLDEPNFLERLLNGAVDIALGIGNAAIPTAEAAPVETVAAPDEESLFTYKGLNLKPVFIGGGVALLALAVIALIPKGK